MLHPEQFKVNDAWIVFRVTKTPIPVTETGPIHVHALMDVGSCFVLSTAFSSPSRGEMSEAESRELFDKGFAHKQVLPRTLFIPREEAADILAREAVLRKIEVIRLPEIELLTFITPVRDGFPAFK